MICSSPNRGDLSIVGFDGIEYADVSEPTRTTVRQPRHALGSTASAFLIDLMAGQSTSALTRLRLEAELVVRDSTAAAQRRTSPPYS